MIDLVTAAKSTQAVLIFIQKGYFSQTLEIIGGVHLRAAQDTMQKFRYASHPREAVNRALTHLETAHVSFRDHWRNDALFHEYKTMKASCRDVWTCMLIALCHKALGDDERVIESACGHLD